jgi:hypothetical protein
MKRHACLLVLLGVVGCFEHDDDSGKSKPSPNETSDAPTTDSHSPIMDPKAQGPVNAFNPPPFTLHPRSQCRVATESIVTNDERDIVSGDPSPALANNWNCVETGHPGADKNVVYTDVDNPRVWTGADVEPYQSPSGGTVNPYWMRDDSEVASGGIDFMWNVTGGEGAANVDRLSGARASIAEPLTPWSASVGPFSSPFMPFAGGLRVGKTPVKVGLEDSGAPTGYRVNVALDPNVLLVPVQVVVFYDDATGIPPSGSLETQLALWDRVPTASGAPWHAVDGVEMVTHRPLQDSVLGGEQGAWEATVGSFNPPDDVWAPCGVQFRLVNYIPMAVTKAYLAPHGHTLISSSLSEAWDLISQHPQFKSNVVTVLLNNYCSDYDQADAGQIYPPTGQSLVGHHFACVRPGYGAAVLSHELGHVIMEDPNHAYCPVNPPSPFDRNVMCPNTTNGVAVKPYEQCKAARDHLQASGMLDWFTAQK